MGEWVLCSAVIDDICHSVGQAERVVYCLHCDASGKEYVGRTCGTLRDRVKAHFESAREGSQFAIHRAIRKHGEESFSVMIIEQSVVSDDDLSLIEMKHIQERRTFRGGYNMTLGGEGTEGYRHSDETKHLISEMKKNKPMPTSQRSAMRKSVQQIDLSTGEVIAEFKSYTSATEMTGICNISMVCHGKLPHAGGYGWRYVVMTTQKKGTWSDAAKKRMKDRLSCENKLCRRVAQIDLKSGEIIAEFTSVKEAETSTGIHNISSVCRSVRSVAGGFGWRYV